MKLLGAKFRAASLRIRAAFIHGRPGQAGIWRADRKWGQEET
jgi:hypothetical protein